MKTPWVTATAVLTTLTVLGPPAQAHPSYGSQGPDPATSTAVVAEADPITRDEVISRARSWLTPPIPYAMDKWHDNWRTDCSGYVSMAWHLDSSLTTVTLPNVSHRIEKEELRAGDAMMNGGPGSEGPNGHVVLFEKWVDDSHNAYWAFEQTPPETVRHQVPYPYFDNDAKFLPYRYNKIQDGIQPQPE